VNIRASQLDPNPPPIGPLAPATTATRTLTVGLVGPGKVGRALLAQLRDSGATLLRELGLDLRLRVVADSRHMWLDHDNATLDPHAPGTQVWRPSSLSYVGACLAGAPHPVLIDCSASDAVASHYPAWLARGIHVITPNKLAISGPAERWRAIRAAMRSSGAQLRYEATVGAGLPVVQTLRDLLDTGDELVAVEGLFSGTLAWLFNGYDGHEPFSARILKACELGYTEPDPRADLGGMDVARKLVILAREAGMDLSLDDVRVQSLVPASLAHVDRETFMQNLDTLDAPLAARHACAAAQGCVLRHVGRLDSNGRARVGLIELPASHPFAHAHLSDNIVQFHTRRYADNPLRIQGPGAGPEVTAAGVFTDLLRVAAGVRA
jgi:homoserine dehydrogenase